MGGGALVNKKEEINNIFTTMSLGIANVILFTHIYVCVQTRTYCSLLLCPPDLAVVGLCSQGSEDGTLRLWDLELETKGVRVSWHSCWVAGEELKLSYHSMDM